MDIYIIFQFLFSILGCGGICYLAYIALQWHIVNIIKDSANVTDSRAIMLMYIAIKSKIRKFINE